jgi:hypothetical protein
MDEEVNSVTEEAKRWMNELPELFASKNTCHPEPPTPR